MEIDELKNKYYTEATVSVFLSEQEQNKLLAEALSAANQASVSLHTSTHPFASDTCSSSGIVSFTAL